MSQIFCPRVFKVLIFFTGYLFATLIGGCSAQEPETKAEVIRPAKLVVVGDPLAGVQRVYPGEVEAGDRSEQAFRVGGELVKLPAKAGSKIKKGQLLAQLDPTDFQLRLNEQQARFDLAQVQFNRVEKLVKEKLIPESDFDKAKSNLLAAKADLNLAKANLSYTELRSPFDGIISKVNVKNHENIRQYQTVLVIQTINAIDITFNLSENVITKLKKSSSKTAHPKVVFDAYPDKTYTTNIKEFDTEADPETRSYKVKLTLDSPKDFIALPGMSVNVFIDFSDLVKIPDAKIIVPVEAVFSPENTKLKSKQHMLWVVDTNTMRAHLTPVVIGHLNHFGLEIKSGVSSGDTIIAAGVNFIKEGQKIKPWVKESGL